MIFGICDLAVFKEVGNNHAGVGIWGGIIITLAGVFSISSSMNPMNKERNVLNLLMHFFAFFVEIVVLVLTAYDLE